MIELTKTQTDVYFPANLLASQLADLSPLPAQITKPSWRHSIRILIVMKKK